GKFKVPFGMEENTSEDRLDFGTRSQVTDYLAAGRERGAMLHGKLLKGNRLNYEAGIFRYDGESSEIQGKPTAGRTYAFRVSEERKEQGIRVNNLPDKISRGWYLTTSWLAFGKMKSKGTEPKKPFLTGRGFGAVELAARLDVLTFYSAERTGLASRSPRASNI